MPRAAADPSKLTGLASRLSAFATERHPLAVHLALDVFEAIGGQKIKPRDHAAIDGLRTPFRRELARRLYDALKAPEGTDSTTPGTSAVKRMEQARAELIDACDGFLRREAIAASLTKTERIEILKGMALTRAVDNRLKQFFMGGEVRWGDMAFQGKGFRSLGQEAIYAAGIRLKRGPKFRGADGSWQGDVVAPVIRDIGIALAMRHDAEAVRNVLTAQMGKDGPPMFGKDLHTGDFELGRAAGHGAAGDRRALARRHGPGVLARAVGARGGVVHRRRRLVARRVARGDQPVRGAEAAGDLLPREQPDRALDAGRATTRRCACSPTRRPATAFPASRSTAPIPRRSPRRSPGRPNARAPAQGPTLIEVIAMRMCGHAHHDDMLYLGKDPQPSWEYHALHEGGYANRELYDFWSKRDPLPRYAAKLEAEGVIKPDRARSHQGVGARAGGGRGAGGDRDAVAEAGDGRRRRVRGRSAAHPRRGARAGAAPGAAADRGPAARSSRACRSTRRATRSSRP